MYHRLPIVAYASTAVPETVRGAGLVLPDKEPVRVAAAIDRVLADEQPAGGPGRGGRRAGGAFALSRIREGFASALDAACAV